MQTSLVHPAPFLGPLLPATTRGWVVPQLVNPAYTFTLHGCDALVTCCFWPRLDQTTCLTFSSGYLKLNCFLSVNTTCPQSVSRCYAANTRHLCLCWADSLLWGFPRCTDNVVSERFAALLEGRVMVCMLTFLGALCKICSYQRHYLHPQAWGWGVLPHPKPWADLFLADPHTLGGIIPCYPSLCCAVRHANWPGCSCNVVGSCVLFNNLHSEALGNWHHHHKID